MTPYSIIMHFLFCYFKVQHMFTYLTPRNSIPPHISEHPKLHKSERPLRVIVSTINSPRYNSSKFLTEFLISLKDEVVYGYKYLY